MLIEMLVKAFLTDFITTSGGFLKSFRGFQLATKKIGQPALAMSSEFIINSKV